MKTPCKPKLPDSAVPVAPINHWPTETYSSLAASSSAVADQCFEAVIIAIDLYGYQHQPGSALEVSYQLPDDTQAGYRRIFRDRMNLWSTPEASSVNHILLDKLIAAANGPVSFSVPSAPNAAPFQWLVARIFNIVIAKSPHSTAKTPMYYVAQWDCTPLPSSSVAA